MPTPRKSIVFPRTLIEQMIQDKMKKIPPIRQRSLKNLSDLATAMFNKTHTVLPDGQSAALEGQAADQADKFLSDITRPLFYTPVKQTQ